MSERTAIEWADATWNPWRGCTRVSAGCDHCYMFREQQRFGQDPTTVLRSRTTFDAPLRWRRPLRIFTCSWSDWFHRAADPWRAEAWDIIRRTPHHTYLILTKRPGLIRHRLPPDWGDGWPHVWLGVSVESEAEAWRIQALQATPARVRFLSCEPLLGPLDLTGARLEGVHWVIAGGESGPACRPASLDWLRGVRDSCTRAHVAFFLKQLGGWPDKRGGDAALLDGRLWNEYPETA